MKELTKVIFKNAYRRDNVNKDITASMSFHDWGFPKISIFLDAYI